MPRFGVPTCIRTVEPEFFPQSLPRYRALASHLFPSASPRPQVGSLFEFFEEFDILKRHHGGKRSIPSRKQNRSFPKATRLITSAKRRRASAALILRFSLARLRAIDLTI
jgi:hypothetical protein